MDSLLFSLIRLYLVFFETPERPLTNPSLKEPFLRTAPTYLSQPLQKGFLYDEKSFLQNGTLVSRCEKGRL